MSLRRLPLRALIPVLLLLATVPAAADITNASLEIQGIGLSLVTPDPPVTTGIDIPTTVQTKFGGKENDEALTILGLTAVGDLTGPGLDSPLELSTAPGHKFQIPGLSREGVYTLQNVRLMKGGELLQYSSPSSVDIIVADLFKTTIEVRQLTPDEIRARGIVIDARNFEVYEYTLSFLIRGETVKIPFPVIIDPRTRQVHMMPIVSPYTLPPISTIGVGRWTPPDIIPVTFENEQLPEDERNTPLEAKEPGEKLYVRPPIPAAIVIPNSLAVMHQFFAVVLTVQNGAPNGSTAKLENVSARIRVPSQLRTATSKPAVALGQAVPLVDKVNGLTILVAQAKAEAEWSVEALKPGTHTIEIELRGTLKENGQEDVPLVARPRASVVVHDARFNIAFSHPDTVRKNIDYTTYSFITNTSPVTQTIILSNDTTPCPTVSGANVCRVDGGLSDTLTIPSGETRTVEYKLRSGVTGKVFATAAHIDSEVANATAQLHMGVSDTGVPLSPTTLIMPHYAQYVSESLVSETMQILGLGYSIATAPVTSVTASLPRVIKGDVYRRAVDIAQAGQAIFIANDAPGSKADAIAGLSIDLLGNSAELSEWDALRRHAKQHKYARPAGAAVTRELEVAGLANGTTFPQFIDNFGKALSHRDPYVAALAHAPGNAGAPPFALSVRGVSSDRLMKVPAEAESGWVRDLPYGELTRIAAPGSNRYGELALLGRWTTEDLEVIVTPSVDGLFELELLYPNATNGSTMRAHLEFTGHKDIPIRVPLSRGATTINAMTPAGGFADTEQSSVVPLEPLRVVGIRQDLYLDENGHKASILFNRPVDGGVPPANLRQKFHGEIDFNKDGVVWMDEPRPISGAALQESKRVIDLTFDHVLTTNATYTVEIDPLVDPRTTLPVSFPGEFVPKIDNDRPAGIIYGRFIRGDNTPLGNHEVILFSGTPNPFTAGAIFEVFENIRKRIPVNPYIQPPQIATTRADGAYLFEFVRRDLEAGFGGDYRLWGNADNLTKYTYVDGAVRLPGRVHNVSLQLLGRGSAEGTVRFDNGEIAKKVNVTVGSTAFEGVRSAITDDNGFYRVEDLPVGPLAFTATDGKGNIGYAAGEVATPGEVEQQDISIYRQPVPKNGSVNGTIRRSDNGNPVAGASVGIFNNGYPLQTLTTDSDGRYNAEKVPAGFISVVAAEWTISRQSANTDFDLRGDEVRQVDLTLSVTPNEQLTTVTGEVLRENPLFPGNASKYEKVAGALVKIDNMRIVTTDANGQFVIPDVPLTPGSRNIGAHDPATRRTERVPLGTLTVAGPNHVPILLRGLGKATVRARLFDARGLPAAGCEMLMRSGGYYAMSEVSPGIYELGNVPVGGQVTVRTGSVAAEYGDQEALSPPVHVAFDGQIVSVSLRLPGEGEVRANVKGISIPSDGGEPILTPLISDVTLTYSVFNSSTLTREPKEILGTTNQNGLPGEAIFTKVPAFRSYSVSSNHPLGHSAAVGTLAFDADLGSHTLFLSNLGHIRGVVYAIDGVTPVPGATVRMEDGHQDQGLVVTGLDGRFEFRNVAPNVRFRLIAESTQAGIYRTAEQWGHIPGNGGLVNTSLTLLERGQIEGKIVYAAYKVYDPLNPANNVADNTPSDLSDNAPVPMGRFWMRELDFPRRDIGTGVQPLSADLAGRFAIDNVFVGRLRATAWSPDNPDLRGDWTATLVREGELLTPYIAIGGGGTGAILAKVTNPNANNAPVENAEVQLFRGGLFDVQSSGPDGTVRFEQLPVGSYVVTAYSKALGKSGRAPDNINVTIDTVSEARVMLTFSGQVTGRLTDPESTPPNQPVLGSHVTISMSEGFAQRFTTNALGEYLFEGVREGLFTLDAKDTGSNRRAKASGLLSAADPEPVVNLELERTETLYVSVYLPDDVGGNSGQLAGDVEMTVSQRNNDFYRSQQGNPIQMSKLFLNESYSIHIQELAGERRTLDTGGKFPKGSASQPISLVYPAYGSGEVLVRRLGAAIPDARVNVRISRYETRVFYSDAAGRVLVTGLPLGGNYSVSVTTLDGSSGSGTLQILRTSVLGSLTVEIGSRATLTGKVIAEQGGPSIGTPVIIKFAGGQLTGTTDDQGSFTFAGVAAPSGIELLYFGPDGVTLGRVLNFHLGAEWAGRDDYQVPTVTLDATPPLLLDIAPEQGAGAVPPDTHLKFVFSEAINTSTIHNDHFSLQAADGTPRVNASFSWAAGANGTFVITMVPPAPPAGQQFPLKSNTLYRLTVSQHVRDLTGHSLGTNRGLTFTTADYIEPRVISTVPKVGTPIPEQITYEFRFNEPLDPGPFAPNGNGVFSLARMSGPGETATVVETISGDAYIDPFTGISLFFAPSKVTLPNSFYRLRFSGVKDLQGNIVPEQTYYMASYDTMKPFVILNSPVPGDAWLVSGLTYKLTPDVRNETANGTPATDIDFVEFFRVENGVETFIKSIKKAPFAYEFVAPDAPAAGLPLVFRAKATDLSVNESEKVEIALTVKPNQPPTVSVALDRITDVFAGERVNATITAADEVIDINLQLDVKATRTDNTEYRKVYPATLHRNAISDPWPTRTIAVDLPINLKGGTPVTFTGIATDMSGLTQSSMTPLTLAVDEIPPTIVSTTPDNGTELAFGTTYQISANVTDVGTGVAHVVFNVDGTNYTVQKSAAAGSVFTSPAIPVAAHSVNTTVPIVVTATDNNGKTSTHSFEVIYLSIDDPTVPTGEWLCGISGATLPANTNNYQLKLRFRAVDDISVTSVKFRLPNVEELIVPVNDKPDEYAATVSINTLGVDKTDYYITAIVTDADPAHTQEFRLRLSFVTPDLTIDSTQAILASNLANYEDKTVIVTGTEAHLVPHVPVRFKNLIVLNGGRVETLSTTTSTERKMDLTVTGTLYIDCASSVDVTGRGYLASYAANPDGSGTTNNSESGRTFGNTNTGGAKSAGASHGGVGAVYTGSTNATYGSYTEPRTLGAGGGSSSGSNSSGNGGGAVAITGTENSRFIIAGGIRADGTNGAPLQGGGAGGSVLLQAADILISSAARVTANGGNGMPGGGGRVALYTTRTLNLPDNSVQARGGWNIHGSGFGHADGGAGTIYIVRPDETEGELRLSSFDEAHPTSDHQVLATPIGTPGGTELVFGSITVGARSMLRIDSPYQVTKTDGTVVDPAGFLFGPEVQPTLSFTSTPAPGSTVWQNAPIALTYQSASGDGVTKVVISLPGKADHVETFPNYPLTVGPLNVTVTVPVNAPAGPATLKVVTTSRSGRTKESTATYTVTSDAAPTVLFDSVLPAAEIHAGGIIAVSASAADDVEVKSLNLTSSVGGVTAQAATKPTPQSMARQFSVSVPKTTAGGTSILLTLSASDGFPSRPTTNATHTIAVLQDTVAPTLTVTKPAPNQELNETPNGTFTIEVMATDAEVGVNTVQATFEGTLYTLQPVSGQPGLYSVSNVPIPSVDGTDPVAKTISISASDFRPNTANATTTVYVNPLIDANAPKMAWLCSSPNALYPAGYGVPLRVSASRPDNIQGTFAVQRVEYTVNGGAITPMPLATGSEYAATFTIPAGTAAGTVFNVRVAAFSTSSNEANLLGTFTVVAGNEITTARDVSATDLSLDNGTVIVRSGGTLTLTGPHTFTNLVVLSGGKVVQKHLNLGNADVLTTAGFYLACGATIDVTGHGYAPRTTYPGERASATNGGAAHIGLGGWRADSGSTYGSIYRPREAGAGEFNRAAGGGVVRIAATRATIDGAIYANGQNNGTSFEGGAAGGSVWITATTVRGAGRIEVNGGNGAAFSASNAGAGAIAIEYTDGASSLPTLQARSGNHYNPYGGAGSIYTRGSQSVYGNLLFDNTGIPVEMPTRLPALGTHIVQSVPTAGTIVLASPASVQPYFAGHWLRVQTPNGTVRGIWRIASVTNSTQLVLESDAANPIDVQAGDTVRGAYRLDSLKLINSWVETPDLVLVGTTPVLDGTSKLYTGNDAAPVIQPSLISFGMGTYGPVVAGQAGAVTDPDKPIEVAVRNTNRPLPADDWTASGTTFGTVGGFSVRKIVNGQLWSSAIAKRSSTVAGYISCRPSQTNKHMDCALTSGATRSYNFGIFDNGTYQIWVDGAPASGTAGYNTSTIFRIERSASTVRWYVNGSKVREQAADNIALFPYIAVKHDDGELNSVHYSVDSIVSNRANAASDGSFTLGVEGGPGDPVVLTARDAHYYPFSSQTSIGTIPADMSVASVTFNPTPVTGGRPSTGTVTLGRAAPVGGAVVQLRSGSTSAVVPASVTVPATQTSATFTVTTQAVTAPADVVITASYGNTGAPGVLQLVKDNVQPAVTITLPAPNTEYTEGAAAGIALQATVIEEDSGLASVVATLDGVSTTLTKNTAKGPNVYTATLPVPFISETTNVTKDIVVTATDNTGNAGTATVPVVIKPVSGVNPPTISWLCSSDATYPIGYAAKLRVLAKKPAIVAPNPDNPLQKVEFFIDGVPYPATLATTDTYEITWTVPAVANGTTFEVMALATTAGGTSASVEGTITAIVADQTFAANATIAATDLQYDNKAIVVTAGTLTIAGAHTFQHLVVLGGNVTHANVNNAGDGGLNVNVTGNVYVSCSATIDVTGRGFQQNVTWPGLTFPANASGGSHMGWGGWWSSPLGTPYGSVYHPLEPGSGTTHAGQGGGVVRISAAKAAIDGVVRANGAKTDAAGAGGSVYLIAGHIAGAGRIEANGGSGYYGSGGGGAIAVEYTDENSVLPVMQAASGPTHSQNRLGGAGTIYTKGPQSTYGNLFVDGEDRVHQWTNLTAFGTGTAGTGSSGPTLVTGRTSIARYYLGHWVQILTPSGTVKGTWRIATINGGTVTLAEFAGTTPNVAEGDTFKGVYRFDNVTLRRVVLYTTDPIITSDQVIEGEVYVNAIAATNLTVKGKLLGAPNTVTTMTIDVENELRVETGGSIDVTGRGYAPGTTHPNATMAANASGGSHMGYGGWWTSPLGSTFGSVTRPREFGAGTTHNGWGGGALRINAASVVVNGAIRANGERNDAGGGGGSIWITTGSINGTGTIEANGGSGYYGSGGGGAISLEYTDPSSQVPTMHATSGPTHSQNRLGGAGTMYIHRPDSTHGDLIIDGESKVHQWTTLPSLGKGTALQGSTGAKLVTGRSENIPSYFEGHWVEIYDADNNLEGTWRVATIDLKTVTFAPNGNETISVDEGDRWQGVYRFDNVDFRGIVVDTPDPIRVGNTQAISGTVTTDRIHATNLVVKAGATLTHYDGGSLTIDVDGELRVDAGGAIDATAKGYAPNKTHPDATMGANASGGSHIGQGGWWTSPLGSTYGSVYTPREAGAGTTHNGNGGGIIRINSNSLIVNGAIRANGERADSGGGGGSIWITTGRISGTGGIETNGGSGYYGSGGGGALSIEYTDQTSVMPATASASGPTHSQNRLGAPGTQYFKRPTSTYGDLLMDGANRVHQASVLPALGKGQALAGSGGATLVTDRPTNISAYFGGHWVEIYSASGTLRGTWRIKTIAQKTVTLAPNASETISIQEGDRWQGVYRFDTVTLRGLYLESADPIRSDKHIIESTVTFDNIFTNKLQVTGSLTSVAGRSILIEAAEEVLVPAGGTIDVTARGYAPHVTYPGARPAGNASGGTHFGRGGQWDLPLGSAYGSVYRPTELGAGNTHNGWGGGAIRIKTANIVVDGFIRANGERNDAGGAGGSVWITTNRITGIGGIEANGGSGYYGSGGGGALAIEYTDLTSVVPGTGCAGGPTHSQNRLAGPGTQYYVRPASVLGDLIVDGANRAHQACELPGIGVGSALSGSDAAKLVTHLATIAPYFVGHWIEVSSATGTVKGIWRIATINGGTVTLAPNGTETISIAEGDVWRGLYRFDNLKMRTATVVSGDPVIVTNPIDKDASSSLVFNLAAPQFPAAKRPQIVVESTVTGDAVVGPVNGVTDVDVPIKLTAKNTRTGTTFNANANSDGSFRVPVSGQAGDTFTIAATDSHTMPLSATAIPVNGAIVELNTISSLTIQPSTVNGGTTVYGSVRLSAPARAAGAIISLASSDDSVVSVPASFVIAGGAVSAQFPITTSTPASSTAVQITASIASSSANATLTVTPSSSALADLVLSASSVEGGTSVDANVILGAPAPPGGALVMLSSTIPETGMPATILIPEGDTQVAFTITTSKVAATVRASISATWGSTKAKDLDLTKCVAMTTATPPSSATMNTVWFDDAAPTGATASGDATFDNTQTATGSMALHFAAGTAIRAWTFTGATALTVAPGDRLVFYALVNPCNPPRQILVQWSDATTQYRASWGENRIGDKNLATLNAGSVPAGGEWRRLEVVAKTLPSFGTANRSFTGLTVSVDGGEAWIDAVGAATCSTAKAAKPSYLANEIVWFDDALPAGAAPSTAYNWDTAQVASGTSADLVVAPSDTTTTQHVFAGATAGLPLNIDDVIVTYVFLDPCNPPREVMLQWNDGTSWNRRAFWGENLDNMGGNYHTVERRTMGALPETGKWVRLEIPVASMMMTGMTVRGMAFTITGGRVWFDRVAKVSRVNLALNKPATQSSGIADPCETYNCPSKAVDGNLLNYQHTLQQNQAYWQVDLGAVQSIDTIDIWNGGSNLCCQERLQNFWLFVSDTPFTSATVAGTLAQTGVTGYYYLRQASRPESFVVNRRGRYVRVQLAGTNYLHIAEVQVWAPVAPLQVNLAAGRVATQSTTYANIYTSPLAVNGNVNGESESHTNSELEAWWQVDLGSVQPISTIDIDNVYTSTGWQRMANFYMFVSDTPFPATNKVADTLAAPGVSAYYRVGPLSVYKYDVNRRGRYVRIQLTGTNYLHPMEVRVWSPSLSISALAKTPARF